MNKIFSTLWGLLGIWILLGGSLMSFFITDKPVTGILFLVGIILIVFLLVSGRATQKIDYSISELILRGILVLAVITPLIIVAVISPSARSYLLFYTLGIIINLILLGIALARAERISVDH